MSLIAVDPAALTEVVRALRDVRDRLDGATRSLAETTTVEAGSAQLTSALLDFHDHWRHGLDTLAHAAGVAGDQLDEAVRYYRDVDGQLAQATG